MRKKTVIRQPFSQEILESKLLVDSSKGSFFCHVLPICIKLQFKKNSNLIMICLGICGSGSQTNNYLFSELNNSLFLNASSLVAQTVKCLPTIRVDQGSIPGSGRSPGEESGTLLLYSCLEYPMDGGAWQVLVHGLPPKARTNISKGFGQGESVGR